MKNKSELMSNNRLPKSYFRSHPLQKMSFAQMSFFHMTAFDNATVTDALVNHDNATELFPDGRLDEIRKSIEEIKSLNNAQSVIDRMRKEREGFCHGALHDRALELEDDIMPLLLSRYLTSGMDRFIEIAAHIFADADIKYSQKLFNEYDNIRNPYAQAQSCIVFGIKKMYETIPLLVSETERLKRIKDPDSKSDLSQAPLLALYVLHNLPLM